MDKQLEDNISEAIDIAVNAPSPAFEGKVTPVKKKPGRPKKNAVIKTISVDGIQARPSDDSNVFELVYSNPILFSKILDLYKQYEVSDVDMLIGKDGVKLRTQDHLNKSTIHIAIDANCMNWYYCREPMRVCIKRSNLEKVFDMLTKDHNKVTMMITEQNIGKKLFIVIKDGVYNISVQYEVDVSYKAEVNVAGEIMEDDTAYPIKFNMTTKHFKALVTRIKKLDKTAIIIQKVGNEPLSFTHEKTQDVKGTVIYNGPEKIELKSTLPPNDIFTIGINLEYITPFTSSGVGDAVYICADKQKKISLMTMLDHSERGWACNAKIYTEIRNIQQG